MNDYIIDFIILVGFLAVPIRIYLDIKKGVEYRFWKKKKNESKTLK